MKRIEALQKAHEIARLILNGTHRLGRMRIGQLPLLSLLPFITLKAKADKNEQWGGDVIDTLNPHIYEVILFGSAADERNVEVNDIDLMIIDTGFFSQILRFPPDCDDWYEMLSDNLELFLDGFLGYQSENIQEILGNPVDLHVLPIQLLRSKDFRSEVGSKHKDPKFLRNCFSLMLRYDQTSQKFVPVNIAQLEEQYKTDLSDLK